MPNWFYIVLTIINGIALIGLFMFVRKIKESIRRQIHVLGEKNRAIVANKKYYVTLYIYALAVFGFFVSTYYMF